MNIALPILLLLFGSLSFWVLVESSVKWYIKTAWISTFCIFTVVFWGSMHSYLGWPANEDDMPEKVLMHWVVIKEPNKITEFDGAIYILAESVAEDKGGFLEFFGYSSENLEPRLYGLSYDRELHEKLQKMLKEKLGKGQPVMGKLTKKDAKGKGKGLKGEDKTNNKGDGSESQKQKWEFHELLPSEIHRKPTR